MSNSSAATNTTSQPVSHGEGYYGVPVIHGPHWKWLIISYFFCGGVSGSSAVVASVARLVGGTSAQPTARLAAYVSALALAPCPALLILDLGRPSRFLNMLRTVRTSSLMSLGTWGLMLFSGLTAVTLGLQVAEDLAGRNRTFARWPRSLLMQFVALPTAASGFFVAGYSGVLLAATAVPLWSKSPRILGPLLLASAMSSGTAAVAAAVAMFEPGDQQALSQLHGLEAASRVAEAALMAAWVVRLGPTAAPVTHGSLGYVARGVAGAGIVAPAVVSALSELWQGRARRAATLLASALTLGGVFALRYLVVVGGRESADDPTATFDMTR